MSEPKERKDEDEITAKSIFDEIVEETERDEDCDESEQRQADASDRKAVAVK